MAKINPSWFGWSKTVEWSTSQSSCLGLCTLQSPTWRGGIPPDSVTWEIITQKLEGEMCVTRVLLALYEWVHLWLKQQSLNENTPRPSVSEPDVPSADVAELALGIWAGVQQSRCCRSSMAIQAQLELICDWGRGVVDQNIRTWNLLKGLRWFELKKNATEITSASWETLALDLLDDGRSLCAARLPAVAFNKVLTDAPNWREFAL